ncbi:MAG: hypothetical protein R2867_37765, partial [Caldilineaceae bacterium]
ENKMKTTTATLTRWAGVAAMVAGLCYVLVGIFHPLNIASSATTPRWIIVHILACVMCFFGLLGMAGLYARQVAKFGWLGLVGYFLLSLWFALILGFTFVEVLILPLLATVTPTFVAGWLGMFTGVASAMNLGALPLLWTLTGAVYILGGLLFGIATFRAQILPRWAGILLAAGTTFGPVAALFPAEHQPKVAVPVGLALVWLGYALWSERRAQALQAVSDTGSPQLHPTAA